MIAGMAHLSETFTSRDYAHSKAIHDLLLYRIETVS